MPLCLRVCRSPCNVGPCSWGAASAPLQHPALADAEQASATSVVRVFRFLTSIVFLVRTLTFLAAAFLATFARRATICGFAATAAALLSAAGLLVHSRPRAALRFPLRDSFVLVPFRDVFRLALLLVRVLRLVSPWHFVKSLLASRR